MTSACHCMSCAGDGSYSIALGSTNLCMDVFNWGTANGAAVGVWNCNGGNNQKWYFRPHNNYLQTGG